jgi:hypothetical protein
MPAHRSFAPDVIRVPTPFKKRSGSRSPEVPCLVKQKPDLVNTVFFRARPRAYASFLRLRFNLARVAVSTPDANVRRPGNLDLSCFSLPGKNRPCRRVS